MESQVRIEELPWVAAIEQFRRDDLSACELAKETLQEITVLTVTAFPYAIIPNKLLQEMRALAKGASLELPLVDEVAADIFMGEFSPKFLQAAKRAADLLEGTLYETYYGIDYAVVRNLPEPKKRKQRSWPPRSAGNKFVELCATRAGVSIGDWDVAKNGMIIEQQQILTTQNLAVLFDGLDLTEELRGHLESLAKRCFEWICHRQQANSPTWHALLIMLKNTAYAWRQMVFYLSLMASGQVPGFLVWANDHLAQQQKGFQNRFQPALLGLERAAQGRSPNEDRKRSPLPGVDEKPALAAWSEAHAVGRYGKLKAVRFREAAQKASGGHPGHKSPIRHSLRPMHLHISRCAMKTDVVPAGGSLVDSGTADVRTGRA